MTVGDRVVTSSDRRGVITAIASNGEQCVVFMDDNRTTETYYFTEVRKELGSKTILS